MSLIAAQGQAWHCRELTNAGKTHVQAVCFGVWEFHFTHAWHGGVQPRPTAASWMPAVSCKKSIHENLERGGGLQGTARSFTSSQAETAGTASLPPSFPPSQACQLFFRCR
mmetsp:Transcript_2576/g.7299  ORF Transcript_2576/g.7299 Transcript_2576/m.7299 type:complete len:111 (-) Transcript_2576:3725-4057(-)